MNHSRFVVSLYTICMLIDYNDCDINQFSLCSVMYNYYVTTFKIV